VGITRSLEKGKAKAKAGRRESKKRRKKGG